jgi:SAM-dependent methyltransferase
VDPFQDPNKEFVNKITYVKGSAEHLAALFEPGTIDIVFCNLTFHHFTRDSWSKTYTGQADIMKQIATVLSKDGRLCILDQFCDGLFYDTIGSRLIYGMTSCKFRPLAKVFKILGAESAGVGVCFLSKKMWMHSFAGAGLVIKYLDERPRDTRWKHRLKHILLMIKRFSAYNVMIVGK